MSPAPISKRFIALLIDELIIFSLIYLLYINIKIEIAGLGVLLDILYQAVFLSSSYQATIGKKLFGMKAISTDGNNLTFIQAIDRSILKNTVQIFALLTINITQYFQADIQIQISIVYFARIMTTVWYGTAFTDKENRTIYDKLAKTMIVNISK